MFECRRKGGSTRKNLSHTKWCQTVHEEPEAISMTFIPIASLLSGIHGSGFLSHGINLYLRCKEKPLLFVYSTALTAFVDACMAYFIPLNFLLC